MKLHMQWKEKMLFTAETDGHTVNVDAKAPVGGGSAMTPKELMVAAVCGCTAMDVAALMRKFRQPLETLSIDADVIVKEGSKPQVFRQIALTFSLKGALDKDKVLEAVDLSQTQYCGVSAMVSKAVPITYKVILNGTEIGQGAAQFP